MEKSPRKLYVSSHTFRIIDRRMSSLLAITGDNKSEIGEVYELATREDETEKPIEIEIIAKEQQHFFTIEGMVMAQGPELKVLMPGHRPRTFCG